MVFHTIGWHQIYIENIISFDNVDKERSISTPPSTVLIFENPWLHYLQEVTTKFSCLLQFVTLSIIMEWLEYPFKNSHLMYLDLSGDRSMVPNLLEIPRSTLYNFTVDACMLWRWMMTPSLVLHKDTKGP